LVRRYVDGRARPDLPVAGITEVRLALAPPGFAFAPVLDVADFDREISLCADVPLASARALHAWLCRVAPLKPWLLHGFELRGLDHTSLTLVPTTETTGRNILLEWQSAPAKVGGDPEMMIAG
jgi:hypothetical protein